MTLNLIVGELIIGNVTMLNVLLEPGNNTISTKGVVDLKVALANLPQLLSSQATALQNGNIEVSASGNSTVYNGLHVEYYEKILNNLTLTTQMSLLSVLIDSVEGLLGEGSASNLSSLLNISSILSSLSNLTHLT